MTHHCDGCEGMGAHWRWCPKVVGQSASWIGQYSQQAEDLADRVGSNDVVAANMLYGSARRLRTLAEDKAKAFQAVMRSIPRDRPPGTVVK